MENIEGFLERFASAKILCVGDLMLDRFVYGEVDRISPEAPVPVFRWTDEKEVPGGVGNVAANLRALGLGVSLVARIGRDAAGERLRRLMDAAGVEPRLVESSVVPTTVKTRFVSKQSHLLRMDQELAAPLPADEEDRALEAVAAALPDAALVIVSDYAKGFLTDSFLGRTIALCREKGKRVLVDPKGRDYRKYAGATIVKPNRKELEAAAGVALDPGAKDFVPSVVAAAKRLLAGIAVDHAVVTLSEKGMVYIPARPPSPEGADDGTIWLPTEGREVYDVSGAGDTTIAVLGAALAVGAGMSEAMALANLAAGIVVGKVGTSIVSPDELASAIERKRGTLPFSRKVMTRGRLREAVAAWQKSGLKVGFTNGCFDCLHSGHLFSLYQAKEHCDRLVVAVNSDASVRRLKGPTRPIQDERTRSLVLAGLEAVDAVMLFDEDTALDAVKAIRPDVIAKEGYSLETWPEARFVTSYGGEVATLKRLEGYSTSNLVERMGRAAPPQTTQA